MLKRLTWTSLVLLVLTLVYGRYAAKAGIDLHSLGGNDRSPQLSCVLGREEFGWIVERHYAFIWLTSAARADSLPLIGRYSFIEALFNAMKWDAPDGLGMHRHSVPGLLALSRLEGQTLSGSPVTVRMIWLPLNTLAIAFAVLPLTASTRLSWRLSEYSIRVLKVSRIRRARQRIYRCRCGYDLRHSRNLCPECGRQIRWVPLNVPTARIQRAA
jgi:hypothetical protein